MLFEWRTLWLGTSSMVLLCFLVWFFAPAQTQKAVATLHLLGKMGSREVARTPEACIKLIFTAGGAGLITAGTVILKVMIHHGAHSQLNTGLLTTMNFILSFLFMQAMGFRLATKQSPLLGAALGRKWRELQTGFSLHVSQRLFHQISYGKWKEEAAASLKTQLLSAMGNLVFVVPSAFVLHWIHQRVTGIPFLDSHSAQIALESLNPWTTGTLGFAAFTGMCLWICAYFGGLVANRFPAFSKTLATTTFNVGLGALLAFIPLLAKRLGMPVDVRHFTLSGGMVALAVASLGWGKACAFGLLSSTVGVLLIGVLNFSVSFTLAFVASLISGRNGKWNQKASAFPEPFLHWVSPHAQSQPVLPYF